MLSRLFTSFMDWALPVNCVFCGLRTEAAQPNICPECTADLPWLENACIRCGMPLSSTIGSEAVCGHCLKHPPPYHTLHTLFSYQFPVDQLILRLKFQQQFIYARLLGELLAKYCAQYYTTQALRPAILLPMPLHVKRLRQRGFNQAVELARPIAKRLTVPIGYTQVKRVKYTQPQMELPLTERAKNVHHAFKANSTLSGMHVVIVDDVITSGHTVHSLALALQTAGAVRIDVWGVARTVR